MHKAKKLLIMFLIVTILMPLLPQNISFASEDSSSSQLTGDEWSEEFEEGPGFTVKGLTKAQRTYFARYIRAWMNENHNQSTKIVIYDSSSYSTLAYQNGETPAGGLSLLRSGTAKPSGKVYSQKIPISCAYFTAGMLHQALGVDWDKYFKCQNRVGYYGTGDSDYADPGKGKIKIPAGDTGIDSSLNGQSFFNRLPGSEVLQEGDVFCIGELGHAVIYMGIDPATGHHQVAETDGSSDVVGIHNITKITPLTVDVLHTVPRYKTATVYRLRPEVVAPTWHGVPSKIVIQWLNCTTEIDPNDIESVNIKYDENAQLFYSGIAPTIGTLGTTNRFLSIIKGLWNLFKEIINYAIGLPALILRMPFVGLAHLAEVMVSSSAQVISENEADSNITLEKIIFNEVPVFDVNIFNINKAGGQELSAGAEGENVIRVLREHIAGWYLAFRNLVITVLFVILLYLGLRMVITNIAEEKAHYKRMLLDWLVSFVIVMFVSYFLVVILDLNDYIINVLKEQMGNSETVYEKVRLIAYTSFKFTEGWYGTIMYIALIWYMIKFAWKYAKRMLTTYILIMLSPLVAISYAIDKIKDNKAQSLGKWLKEIAYTVLIQSVHCLIYVTFVAGIIEKVIKNGNDILQVVGVTVFLIISIKFMETAENLFKTIFGFENSSVLKEVMSTSFEMFVKFKLATRVAKAYFKGAYKVGKGIGKAGIAVGKGGSNLLAKVSPVKYGGWRERRRGEWAAFKEGINEAKNGGPEIDYSEETTTGINKLAKLYESRNREQSLENRYKGKGKEARKLAGKAATSALQGIHFVLDESTSAIAGISKLIAAGTAGIQFRRVFQRVTGGREKRDVRRPGGGNRRGLAEGGENGSGSRGERRAQGREEKLSRLDKRMFHAPKGISGELRRMKEETKGKTMLYHVHAKDVEYTKAFNVMGTEGIFKGFTETASKEDILRTKTALGILTEQTKTPDLRNDQTSII